MAKNYESESKASKNRAGASSKNCTDTAGRNAYGNEMNTRSENRSAGENASRNKTQNKTQNKNQNKASQSYTSEGNTTSGY